jgi:CheY-like chemotaxis protein
MVDPGQIQQVVLNIVANAEFAITQTGNKGIFSVQTERINNNIRISFHDDGPGISGENLSKIFDPFFTTRQVGQGTGLGLSICYGIITDHNGRIWAESEPGMGTTFIVEIPIIIKDKQRKTTKATTKIPERGVKSKILAIDDEPVILQFLSRVLTEEGYSIDTTDNTEEALKKIMNNRYRLILMDIKMPHMSGIDLYKFAQEISPSLAKRIVFITGDVMGLDTRQFISEINAHCITKPFDIARLKEEINQILSEN